MAAGQTYEWYKARASSANLKAIGEILSFQRDNPELHRKFYERYRQEEVIVKNKKKSEREVSNIMYLTYREWRQLDRSKRTEDTHAIIDFGRQYPKEAARYRAQKQQDEEKVHSIMEIKDRASRRKMIARNLDIFQ